jgi:hypothetical protein
MTILPDTAGHQSDPVAEKSRKSGSDSLHHTRGPHTMNEYSMYSDLFGNEIGKVRFYTTGKQGRFISAGRDITPIFDPDTELLYLKYMLSPHLFSNIL